MKIAITITDITGDGGTERTSILIANLFCEKGHDVTIISLFKKNQKEYYYINPKINIIYLCLKPYTLILSKIEKITLLLSSRKILKKVLRIKKFDEIISQAFLPTFLFFSIGYARDITACEHFKYALYNKIVIYVRNNIYRRCKHVITLTSADSEKFNLAGVKNVIIPNMVTFPLSYNIGQNSKKIISAGRLSLQKGYDLLIKAMVPVFKKYPDWSLDIYGNGELKSELISLTHKYNISNNISFCGFSNNLIEIFRKSSFYVMSSRFEGFPMILLEAISQNLPCISFNCPEGPSEILRNGGGLLVEHENVEELSKAIITFIENKQLRIDCAKQAIINIMDYSPSEIYSKWIDLFEKR